MSYTYSGNQQDPTMTNRTITSSFFDPSKCGTYAGYHRHRRYGVPACDACRVANADYTYQIRQARKAAA